MQANRGTVNSLSAQRTPTQARTTGPVKNVKDMLAGIKVADTPRVKATEREVVNKVKQSIDPTIRNSGGATTKRGQYGIGTKNPPRMGHGFGGGSY